MVKDGPGELDIYLEKKKLHTNLKPYARSISGKLEI